MNRPLEDIVTIELANALRSVAHEQRVAFIARVCRIAVSARAGEVIARAHGEKFPAKAARRAALIGLGVTSDQRSSGLRAGRGVPVGSWTLCSRTEVT